MKDAARPVEDLAAGIAAGSPAAVARGITWCEEGGPRARALLTALPPGKAHVFGITGSPGSGKSTLINVLLKAYRKRGVRVGVVAVDPSSPFSGGALLGDRFRLEDGGSAPDVFFRSLASRGAAGGLSAATRAAVRVLSAASYDAALIETVGAGQAEVDIMRVAQTVAVVLTPGTGDEMQALKAGIMEIADIFILNKADRPGIHDLRSHLAALLHARDWGPWIPPIASTVATEGRGVEELMEAIDRHRAWLENGAGEARMAAAALAELLRTARAVFDEALCAERDWAEGALGATDEASTAAELVRRAARRLLNGTGDAAT